MPPVHSQVAAFSVAGITVRTCNREEMDPITARIGRLWERFFTENWQNKLPRLKSDGLIYGVYHAYESDQHGAFDVTAGVAVPAGSEPIAGAIQLDVQAGDYLVFRGQGAMPQTVIDTWSEVWRYFAENPQTKRRFGTDFEAYEGPDRVTIYIGI